jgi:1-acyl-sn-glycerol-3-phosphate acyltransferase
MAVIVATDRDPLRRRAGRFLHACGRLVTRLRPSWRIRLEGVVPKPEDGVFILVSNHQSHTDIPVICHLPLDFKWVAKKELFSIPVVGWMFGMAGQVGVNRKDSRAGAKALIQAAHYLKHGMPVLFFPEGTRSRNGELLRFQEGPFRLAMKSGTPILPVVIEGTGALLPRNTLLFTDANEFTVRVLAPVSVSDGEWASAGDLRDAVYASMQAELDKTRGLASSKASSAPEDALVS